MRGSDNTVPAGAMAGAAAAASSADGGRSRRPSLFGVERETEGSFVHVSVFPGEDYVLRGNCNVLIFAEDKKKARQGIMDLEVSQNIFVYIWVRYCSLFFKEGSVLYSGTMIHEIIDVLHLLRFKIPRRFLAIRSFSYDRVGWQWCACWESYLDEE